MIFNNKDDDDKREDFFENTPPPKPKPPKAPKISPSDPKYWLKEEDPWEHLRDMASRRSKILWMAIGAVFLIVVIWLVSIWLFGTSTSESVVYGYVDNIERRGKVMKTYEGTLIPYKEIHDTTRTYQSDFHFSIPEAQGKVLAGYRDSGKPVKITYKTYNAAMPWRGESRRVVVRVDTVNPATILPAEFDSNPLR